MFRNLAQTPNLGPENLFLFHPADLVAILELAWDHPFKFLGSTGSPLPAALGSPGFRSDLNGWNGTWYGDRLQSQQPPMPPSVQTGSFQPDLNLLFNRVLGRLGTLQADHLIYAYMIENTRCERIFRRVIHEFVHGEKLGTADVNALHWLRNTEVLFFRDSSPFFVSALQSSIRPDGEAIRRNAYQRMFGMRNLNHGTADGKPYPYVRAEAANAEFDSTFEELLRETWIGMINANNSSGVRPIDDDKLRDLAQRLERMLLARRLNGALSREEFAAVAMMSWFHLTLETDTPIVQTLRAQSTSPEQRLFKIAQIVGVPAHGLSGSYFDIADAISRILLLIEAGAFTNTAFPSAVAGLYTPGAVAEPFMRTIITHWSIITGRDMKAGRIAPTEAARRPAEMRTATMGGADGLNSQPLRNGVPQITAEHD